MIQRQYDVEISTSKCDVVSTLKKGCTTSRPNINVESTLKQRCVPAGKRLLTNIPIPPEDDEHDEDSESDVLYANEED